MKTFIIRPTKDKTYVYIIMRARSLTTLYKRLGNVMSLLDIDEKEYIKKRGKIK